MKTTYLFPIITALLIVLFYLGLPDLKRIPLPQSREKRFDRRDALLVALLTLIYAAVAFWNLGDTQAPQTVRSLDGQSAVIDLGGEENVSRVQFYTGIGQGSYTFEFSPDGETWLPASSFEQGHAALLKWQELDLSSAPQTPVRYLRISGYGPAELGEVAVYGEDGRMLPILSDCPELCDEQALVPAEGTYLNSSYFDEIYHARTAWEHLRNIYPYEVSHPPLGKLILSVGIALFGMTPFGWRFMGTLFGVLMLPLMYAFVKKLYGGRLIPGCCAVIFAADFMHFTQTRIATIDVYITFFVIAMYLSMYEYVFYTGDSPRLREAARPLLLCGLSMGLGVACKWTGVYAGMGLAVIFFASLLIRWRRCLQAQAIAPEHSRRALRADFRRRTKTTILLCVVFFVVAPVLIYMTSYLLFEDGSNHGMVQKLLENQRNMFLYHTAEKNSHTFASRWYEWPIMKKPIWYYTRILTGEPGSGGLRENISAFGNPAVWWVGIPAGVYMFWRAIARRDGTAAFLLTGYAAQYLPWCLVSRTTFIYHYFPSVPFVVLMLVHSLNCWKERLPRRVLAGVCLVYGALAFGLFLLFYPVLSGQPAEAGFIVSHLRWLDSWVLTME